MSFKGESWNALIQRAKTCGPFCSRQQEVDDRLELAKASQALLSIEKREGELPSSEVQEKLAFDLLSIRTSFYPNPAIIAVATEVLLRLADPEARIVDRLQAFLISTAGGILKKEKKSVEWEEACRNALDILLTYHPRYIVEMGQKKIPMRGEKMKVAKAHIEAQLEYLKRLRKEGFNLIHRDKVKSDHPRLREVVLEIKTIALGLTIVEGNFQIALCDLAGDLEKMPAMFGVALCIYEALSWDKMREHITSGAVKQALEDPKIDPECKLAILEAVNVHLRTIQNDRRSVASLFVDRGYVGVIIALKESSASAEVQAMANRVLAQIAKTHPLPEEGSSLVFALAYSGEDPASRCGCTIM